MVKKKAEAPKLARTITNAMATWSFIGCFFGLFATWALWNSLSPESLRFDPYPFILFNLFLSGIAAVQGSVIMIYQKYADAERDKMLVHINTIVTKLEKLEKERMKEDAKPSNKR